MERRKVATFRGLQLLLVLLGGGLIILGVVFAFPPRANIIAAALSTLAGALTLGLGWPALASLGVRNRRHYDVHLREVRDQVSLVAGTYGTRQGVVLSDWRNARWRDEGPNGERATYLRLPLLVSPEDVRWPVANASKTNTGVPIDEISGMVNTLRHLSSAAPGQLDFEALLRDARRCLANWRGFDTLFEVRLLALAHRTLADPVPDLEVSWSDLPWSPPRVGCWRLGGEALVFMSMVPPQTVDRPRFHPSGSSEDSWFVRLGDSSIWLMTGSQPVPRPEIGEAFDRLLAVLMVDPSLRASYNEAVEFAVALGDRVNVARRVLSEYPLEDVQCDYCRPLWILAPPTD